MQIDPVARDARISILRNDPVRLDALVCGMASFLGSILSLRDAGVRNSETAASEPILCGRKLSKSPSLAKLFLDVGRYLPTVQMLEDNNEANHLIEKAKDVRRMENAIVGKTFDGILVMLAEYVRLKSFRTSFTLHLRQHQEPCTIGGMRHRLIAPVQDEVCEWLANIAALLERNGIAPATPAGLNRAIAFTSEKIARRITLADEPAAPDTPALRAAALRDFGDCSDAEIPDNRCVDCLGVAIELALWGSRSFVRDADGPAVRRCVAKVVASVQPSIGFVGINASLSNLARLDLALQVDDIEPMWEAIDEWQKQSGAYAYLALLQVLFVLTSTDELPEHMHVLRAPDAPGTSSERSGALMRLPPPSFCAPLEPYVFDRDAIGEKTIDVVLYLVTAQILYSPHSFELGIVTRASARAAYNDAVSESTNLILHVRESTEHLRIGLPLRDFLRVVLDRHSFNFDLIRRAMCSLSSFSIQEIFDAFDPNGPLYPELRDRLQLQTAGRLTVPLPRHAHGGVYSGFALDGLIYGLPILYNERNACGVLPTRPTRIFHDLLRTADLGRGVVQKGVLYLPKGAVEFAHRDLKRMLEELLALKWVRVAKPSLQRGIRSTTEQYCIPTDLLCRL